MASEYYNPSDNDKYVEDGQTCYADDLNKVNNAANAGFEGVEVDVTQAQEDAVENAGLSKEWAANDQGDLPSNPAGDPPNTDKYSSKANAVETEDWASAVDGDFATGDTIHLADGTTVSEPSAKTCADHAETQADDAETAKGEAEVAQAAAEAAAAEAIATNTISAGENIVVVKTGTDPYDYEVSYPTPSQSAVLAHRASAQSIPDITWTLVEYNVEDYDKEGDYNPSTYNFTAPETGYYLINACVEFNAVQWAVSEYCMLGVFVNGSGPIATGPKNSAPGSIIQQSCAFTKIVYLTSGQTLGIKCYHYQGSTLSIGASGYANWLSIGRIA